MNWKNTAYLCLFGICLASCHLSDPEDEIVQIGVDEEIIVDLVQTINNGEVELGMTFVSSTPYDCGGAGYDYNLYTAQGKINIYLTSVLLPQPCAAGPTHAREHIPIPNQPGESELTIGIGDLIQNAGSLVIDDNSFSIHFDKQHGIAISNNVMYRIPQFTIWGYVHHATEQEAAFEEVLTSMDPLTDPVNLTTGYYGLFNALSPSTIQVLQPGLKSGTQSFVFRFNRPLSELQSAITQLKSSLPAGTELKVFAWEGSVF
jgi:hypothetical protein